MGAREKRLKALYNAIAAENSLPGDISEARQPGVGDSGDTEDDAVPRYRSNVGRYVETTISAGRRVKQQQ